jgi:hypothetical protein
MTVRAGKCIHTEAVLAELANEACQDMIESFGYKPVPVGRMHGLCHVP